MIPIIKFYHYVSVFALMFFLISCQKKNNSNSPNSPFISSSKRDFKKQYLPYLNRERINKAKANVKRKADIYRSKDAAIEKYSDEYSPEYYNEKMYRNSNYQDEINYRSQYEDGVDHRSRNFKNQNPGHQSKDKQSFYSNDRGLYDDIYQRERRLADDVYANERRLADDVYSYEKPRNNIAISKPIFHAAPYRYQTKNDPFDDRIVGKNQFIQSQYNPNRSDRSDANITFQGPSSRTLSRIYRPWPRQQISEIDNYHEAQPSKDKIEADNMDLADLSYKKENIIIDDRNQYKDVDIKIDSKNQYIIDNRPEYKDMVITADNRSKYRNMIIANDNRFQPTGSSFVINSTGKFNSINTDKTDKYNSISMDRSTSMDRKKFKFTNINVGEGSNNNFNENLNDTSVVSDKALGLSNVKIASLNSSQPIKEVIKVQKVNGKKSSIKIATNSID